MEPGHDVSDAKRELRARVLAARRDRPLARRSAASSALATALLPHLTRARVIAAYAPYADEPGYGAVPAVFTRLQARVLLPVVPDDGRELAWAVGDGRMARGRLGVLEPIGPRLPAGAIGNADVVVVPAVAVAADGTRLGRGGGYYDRALLHCRPGTTLVALVFDEEFVPALPAETHDRRVTAVITPSGGWQDLPG